MGTKTIEPAVGVKKRFLREVIRQRGVAMDEVPEKTAHRGLVALDQEAKRGAVARDTDAGNQFFIGKAHDGADRSAFVGFLREASMATEPYSSRARPMKPGIAPM